MGHEWLQIYKDDFTNGTVDLSTYDGSGGGATITEPTGTLISLSASNTIMRDVPFFHEHLGAYENSQVVDADEASGYGTGDLGAYRFEWKFRGISNIANRGGENALFADSAIGEGQTGGSISNQGRKAKFWVGLGDFGWRIGFTRLIASYQVTDYITGYSPADPANMNILFRYYYNRMERQYWYLEDEDILLPPRTPGATFANAAFFSLDNGDSWIPMALNSGGTGADTDAPGVQISTGATAWENPEGSGTFVYPNFTAKWDYIKVEKINRDTISSATPAPGRKIAVRTERRSMTTAARVNNVFLLEGGNWIEMSPAPTLPTNMFNFGLWGDVNPANSYLVASARGDSGNWASHFESGGWITNTFPTPIYLEKIDGPTEDNVWGVGGDFADRPVFLNWDSNSWSFDQTYTGTTGTPTDLFVSPAGDGELWCACNKLLLHRSSGGTITDITSQLSGIMDEVYCVWGTAANNLYVGGSTTAGRSRIAKWNGTGWSTAYTNDSGGYSAIVGIFGTDAENVFAVMDNYADTSQDYHRVLYWNGFGWSEQELPKAEVDTHIQDIRGFGSGANELVVTGAGSTNGDTTRDFGSAVWVYSGDVAWSRHDLHDNLYDWHEAAVFVYKVENNPPVISNQTPDNGAIDINHSARITFSISDDTQVNLNSVVITVAGQVVFQNGSFITEWELSSIVVNDSNGYDFILIHNTAWTVFQTITVDVYAEDESINPCSSSWSFTTGLITVPFLGHQITVSNIEVIGSSTPGAPGSIRPINRLNQFDEHGSIVGVTRLRGEKNYAYKRRIQDAMVHRANSSYRGMVNGITRELGLTLFEGLSINPKRDGNGQLLASDPYIAFDGAYLLLYSDLSTDSLDWAIDRHQTGGNFEHLGRLVDVVNNTEFFEAELLPGIDPFMRSMSILNQSNRNEVRIEFVPQSTKFRLKHQHIVPGSLFFSNRNTFRLEVTAVTDVTSRGKYHVDYTTGIVTVYTTPRDKEYARYRYTQYPFRALASPVILHDINRDSFRVKMFEQVLQDNGEFAHGLPTELGVDIINELMSVSPMYWGI